MSVIETNRLYTTTDWPDPTGATSSSVTQGLSDRDALVWASSRWRAPTEEVLAPTAWGPNLPADLGRNSVFSTYGRTKTGKPMYSVIDLRGALPFEAPPEQELETPILSLRPRSRMTVKAKVQVQAGRLSLVIPDVLREEE